MRNAPVDADVKPNVMLVGGHRDWRPRQQTLRALMDWSAERCTSEQRLLWARMSVSTPGTSPVVATTRATTVRR